MTNFKMRPSVFLAGDKSHGSVCGIEAEPNNHAFQLINV